jgi:uncharacterized protein
MAAAKYLKKIWWIALLAVLAVVSVSALQDLLLFPGILIRGASSSLVSGELIKVAEKNFITTADGKQVEVWHIAPSKPGPQKTAILFHAGSEVLETSFPLQSFLGKLGYSAYALEYRGVGRSSGWPSERGIYLDAEAIWNYALRRDGVSPGQVLVLGQSIGAGPAAYLAAKYQPRTLVLLSAYVSLPEVVSQLPYFRHFSKLLRYRFPVAEYLKQINRTCVVLLHGESDTSIPVSHSRMLAGVLEGRTPLQAIYVPRAGHHDLLIDGRRGLVPAITQCEQWEYPRASKEK